MPNTGFDNKPGFGASTVNNLASNLAGVVSTRPNAKFMSGARCTLKINNKLVGFAFGISWNINTTVTEINTIDNYLPYELAPQRITVEGTISALHIPGESAGTDAWQGNVMSFLFAPYIAIEARDSTTNQIIFATDKAMIVSRSEELRVDQLSNITLRWKAIGYMDEQAPELDTQAANYNKASTAVSKPGGSPTNSVINAVSGLASKIGL